MKALTSILALFILAGCSIDEGPQPTATDGNTVHLKKSGIEGAVFQNPYAPAGVLYQEILDAYYVLPADNKDVQEMIARIETIALSNPGFLSLSGASAYSPLTPSDLVPYEQDGSLGDLLSDSYSDHAKDILTTIAAQLESMKAQDLPYQNVEAYFNSLDNSISADTLLSEKDKTALFTTTALVCNALDNDRKRKRRDRDWEWMTTHLAATANASLESVPEAIMLSLATDIYSN